MNNAFDKIDKQIADINLMNAIRNEQTIEYYRQTERSVKICEEVLIQYQTHFKNRGFVVRSSFNTHYFDFNVNDYKYKIFPSFTVAIANSSNNLPEIYLTVNNIHIQIGIPKIDIHFNDTIFKQWLDDAIAKYFIV